MLASEIAWVLALQEQASAQVEQEKSEGREAKAGVLGTVQAQVQAAAASSVTQKPQ